MPLWLAQILPFSSYYRLKDDAWERRWGKALERQLDRDIAFNDFNASPLGRALFGLALIQAVGVFLLFLIALKLEAFSY